MSTAESKEVRDEASPRTEFTNETGSLSELSEFVTASGHKFYGRPQTSDAHIIELVVDQNEYNLPDQFQPDDVVIDIGAHIGGFSFAVLTRGAGKVYAYEAHPENHAIALKNLARFGNKVSCEQRAVWRSDQPSQTLYLNDLTGLNNTGGVSLLYNDEGQAVETIDLDEIIFTASDGFRRPVRLLKIDTEGSEYPILFTSNQLHLVEEICGEYHEVSPEDVPERAMVPAKYEPYDRFALKEFFDDRGWSVVFEPQTDVAGHFRAKPNTASRVEELNLDEVMAQIRAAVKLREANGQTSFINASTELFKLISEEGLFFEAQNESDYLVSLPGTSEELPRLRLQPRFQPNAADRYHVNDLLQYHDHDFIWNAYRAILKREPDEVGLRDFLGRLRSGSRNKIDILASLRSSTEGQRANVTIEGLAFPAFIRKVYRIPVIGYLMELAVTIARLPKLVSYQRQLENHFVAQQDRLAGHITLTNHQLYKELESVRENTKLETESLRHGALTLSTSFTSALTKLSARQRELAVLQHQQVSSLFREQQNLRSNPEAAEPVKFDLRSSDFDETSALLTEYLRGDRETIKKDLEFHLSTLKKSGITSGILDLGCGSGTWLELLKDSGIRATGVDGNARLVEIGRRRDLNISHADVVEHLLTLEENSLQAITAFHLLEHFDFRGQLQLLAEIHRVLKPGGILLIETPNPKNLVVAACNFYADPSHRRPLFPETIEFVLKRMRFVRTRIDYIHPVEGSPFNDSAPGSSELHSWLYCPRDFAVTAWKP